MIDVTIGEEIMLTFPNVKDALDFVEKLFNHSNTYLSVEITESEH